MDCSLPGSSVQRFSSKNSGMDFYAFIHGISPDPGIEPISITSPALTGRGFPGGSEDKASACNAGDPGSIPGLGKSLGEGNGNPLQYSCLENPMDIGAWQAYSPWGHKESDTTEQSVVW